MVGPKRTAANKTGVIGEHLVQANLSKFAVCNPLKNDFGIDLLCHIAQGASISSYPFFVQIKSLQKFRPGKQRIHLKFSTVEHWFASPVPVYLILCVLEPTPVYLWRNAPLEITHQHDWLEIMGAETRRINLSFLREEFFEEIRWQDLVNEVHSFHLTLDRSISAMLRLREYSREAILNDPLPPELGELHNNLRHYYAMPEGTRAALIETFFSTWERLDNRYLWGYPVGTLKIAFLTGHIAALKSALKGLYYMESDVIFMVDAELSWVCRSVDLEVRQEALLKSLREFHRTLFVKNDSFTEIVGRKLAAISSYFFSPLEAVPALVRVRAELRAEFPNDGWGLLSPCPPDSIMAISQALEHLRFYPEPKLAASAIDWFEQQIVHHADWDYKVHVLSYHHLYERRRQYPRSFEEMIPEAQRLILDGLRRHPDPLVRLDCLKVYSREVERFSQEIATYISAKLVSTEDQLEIGRLRSVQGRLEEYVRSACKDESVVQPIERRMPPNTANRADGNRKKRGSRRSSA